MIFSLEMFMIGTAGRGMKSLPYIWLWCASLNSFSNLSPSSSTDSTERNLICFTKTIKLYFYVICLLATVPVIREIVQSGGVHPGAAPQYQPGDVGAVNGQDLREQRYQGPGQVGRPLHLQGGGGAVDTVSDVQNFQLWIVLQDRREEVVRQPVLALYDEGPQVGGGLTNVLEYLRRERRGRIHFQFFVHNKE